jgi:hypothetical protein
MEYEHGEVVEGAVNVTGIRSVAPLAVTATSPR